VVQARSRAETVVRAVLVRVVDTRGWISGDFHVHGVNSFDANVQHEDQVRAMAAEGVELLSTSDHDFVTDLAPTVREMGMEQAIRTQVGIETTTVEIGHFLGHPLLFDDRAPENGAVDWTGQSNWGKPRGPLKPQEIFDAIRRRALLGADEMVLTVAHPRDGFFGYWSQYGLDPYRLRFSKGSLQTFNRLLDKGLFSDDYDAFEIFNGKRFELIRTPTVPEIRCARAATSISRRCWPRSGGSRRRTR
jgi:hypothetical protein